VLNQIILAAIDTTKTTNQLDIRAVVTVVVFLITTIKIAWLVGLIQQIAAAGTFTEVLSDY